MFMGRVECRAVNVLFRIVGIAFVLLSSVALVYVVNDAVTGNVPRTAEGLTFYVVSMLVAFGCGAVLGVVMLKTPSFRPDLPWPKRGDRVKWWTGDRTE